MNAADQLRILIGIRGECVELESGVTELACDAIRGGSAGEMFGVDGALTRWQTVDWLVVAEDLEPLGMPPIGTTLTVDDVVYTVRHPDERQPAVVYHGDRSAYRIHTVSEE